MRILIVPGDRVLVVDHDGKQVKFRYSVWTTLSSKSTEEIFGPLNEYLATMDADALSDMFEQFQKAESLFDTVGIEKGLREQMQQICCEIVKHFDPVHVKTWAIDNANFYLDPPQPSVGGSNPAALTYLPEQLFELRCLCVASKILTPIIGRYVDAMKDIVDTRHKERKVSEIYVCTNFANWPAYHRFDEYISALAARRSSSAPAALRFKAAGVDLDKWLMGLAIVRRFTISRLRTHEDGSIIAYIYTFLNEKINNLGKDEYREKFMSSGNDNSSEGDSQADQYRIPEDIPLDFEVSADEYLKDPNVFLRDLKFSEEEFRRWDELRNHIYSITDEFNPAPEIHYGLTALVIKDVIDYPVIENVGRDAFISAVAATAVVFERNEKYDLAKLLISRRTEKDPRQMSFAMQSTQVVKRLTQQLDAELSRCYPYVTEAQIKANTNPGKLAIENIVKVINAHDWLDLDDVNNIRISIAEYICSIVPEELKTKPQ
jgi:hypothetical protein